MSLNPKKFREFVLQTLYARTLNPQEVGLESFMNLFKITKKIASHVYDYAKQVADQSTNLDKSITILSKEWSLERISMLERQILRYGLFELKKKELEDEVVISEMIRLCKKFSTEASSEYIHAILDAYIKQRCVNDDGD